MILLIKKVENRSIKKKKKWKVIPIFFFWKTNVKEKCGCERKKVFLFF